MQSIKRELLDEMSYAELPERHYGPRAPQILSRLPRIDGLSREEKTGGNPRLYQAPL